MDLVDQVYQANKLDPKFTIITKSDAGWNDEEVERIGLGLRGVEIHRKPELPRVIALEGIWAKEKIVRVLGFEDFECYTSWDF